MATAQAVAAINTLIKYGNQLSPETFVTIANVGSITGPTMDHHHQDVTSHSTGIPWQQKFPTLYKAGTLTFDVFFVPNADAHENLLAVFFNQTTPVYDFQIQFPAGAGAKVWSFQGFISKMNFTEKVEDVVRAMMTIEITGQLFTS